MATSKVVVFSFNVTHHLCCYFLTSHLFRSSGFPHPLMKSLVRRSFRYKTSNLLTPISGALSSEEKSRGENEAVKVYKRGKSTDCNTKGFLILVSALRKSHLMHPKKVNLAKLFSFWTKHKGSWYNMQEFEMLIKTRYSFHHWWQGRTTSTLHLQPVLTVLELIKQRVALISVLSMEPRWQSSSVSVGWHKHISEWSLKQYLGLNHQKTSSLRLLNGEKEREQSRRERMLFQPLLQRKLIFVILPSLVC